MTVAYRAAEGRRSPELVLMLHLADQWSRRNGHPTFAETQRMARAVARQGCGGDTEIAHVTRGGGRIGKRKAFV